MTDNIVTRHSGFDYFTPEPGTVHYMQCKACESEMSVERNKQIYKYRYPGNTGETHPRDVFTCDSSGEPWHNQVIALRRLILSTPSSRIAQMLEDEIRDIIRTKQPTKENWLF